MDRKPESACLLIRFATARQSFLTGSSSAAIVINHVAQFAKARHELDDNLMVFGRRQARPRR
jgi:hypothetical protein